MGSRGRRTGLIMAAMLAIGLFGCCGGIALFGARPENGIRVEQLEADLRANVPLGSSREQAEAWITAHGFTPEGISDKSGRRVGLAAMIPNDSLLDSAEIRLYIYFDDTGRVREVTIFRFVYSF
ncbi:MAG: hypothetical protein JWO38_1751 [Gemmataceae bacterium]|nr:hypothetical protein [Gemmataceae bacterium]